MVKARASTASSAPPLRTFRGKAFDASDRVRAPILGSASASALVGVLAKEPGSFLSALHVLLKESQREGGSLWRRAVAAVPTSERARLVGYLRFVSSRAHQHCLAKSPAGLDFYDYKYLDDLASRLKRSRTLRGVRAYCTHAILPAREVPAAPCAVDFGFISVSSQSASTEKALTPSHRCLVHQTPFIFPAAYECRSASSLVWESFGDVVTSRSDHVLSMCRSSHIES